MKTIHKFLIEPNENPIQMPAGAKFLCVQVQRDEPYLWVEVDTDAPMVPVRIAVVGTGWELPKGKLTYISTFQLAGGSLVFHAYHVDTAVDGDDIVQS